MQERVILGWAASCQLCVCVFLSVLHVSLWKEGLPCNVWGQWTNYWQPIREWVRGNTHTYKTSRKIRSLFRKTHISSFVNKKIGTIDYCTCKNIKSFTKKLWSTQLSFSVRRYIADFVNAMLKNKLWCILVFFKQGFRSRNDHLNIVSFNNYVIVCHFKTFWRYNIYFDSKTS